MEPKNVADKYTVSVKKNNVIMGHLPLGERRFAKVIYYFLRADSYAECNVIITGDGECFKAGFYLRKFGHAGEFSPCCPLSFRELFNYCAIHLVAANALLKSSHLPERTKQIVEHILYF